MLGACILCTVLFTACGNANPTGAPAAACSTMVPQHGVASQNLSSSPYKIAVAVDSNDASKVKGKKRILSIFSKVNIFRVLQSWIEFNEITWDLLLVGLS